jgi:hypothetical protein
MEIVLSLKAEEIPEYKEKCVTRIFESDGSEKLR